MWYENRPLGVNKLSTIKKNISSEAGLSHIYTNHSVMETAITLWANSGLTNREIMAISGHRNESRLQNYHSIPSVKQLCRCSDVLCTALGHDDKVDKQSTTTAAFLIRQHSDFSNSSEHSFIQSDVQFMHYWKCPHLHLPAMSSIFLFLSIFRLHIDSYTHCRHFFCNSRIIEV